MFLQMFSISFPAKSVYQVGLDPVSCFFKTTFFDKFVICQKHSPSFKKKKIKNNSMDWKESSRLWFKPCKAANKHFLHA